MIDADALPRHEQLEPMGNGKYENIEVVYGDDIDTAPTIDAVEVVRCKDCKWRNWETNGCNRNPCVEPWFENDFCSYGERKDK